MTRVAILHPGEMGAAVGAALRTSGHEVCWLPAGRGKHTRLRAEAQGFVEVERLDGCDVVISVCPPAAARDVAARVSGFTGCYVDANAISPATAGDVAATIQAGGAEYVDGGIIGPPPYRAGTSRLYVSGASAGEVAALFAAGPLEARVLRDGDPYTAASALKMAFAAWSKISAAVLLAAESTARELGLDVALRAEWELSQPALAATLESARLSAAAKGWRWHGEMREIAATFGAVGQPTGFAEAAAELYARYPRPSAD